MTKTKTQWTETQHNEAMKATMEAASLYPYPTHSTVAPFIGVRWASLSSQADLAIKGIEDADDISTQSTSAITGPVVPKGITTYDQLIDQGIMPDFSQGITVTFNDRVKLRGKEFWAAHGGFENNPDCMFTPMGIAWHEYGHVLSFANGVMRLEKSSFELDLRHIALLKHYGLDYEEVKTISDYADQGGPTEAFGDLNAILHCDSRLLSKDMSIKAAHMFRDLGHGECPRIEVSKAIRDQYPDPNAGLQGLLDMLKGLVGSDDDADSDDGLQVVTFG